MIQTILLFLLGFFSAGFLALLLAPLFWRRAVRLTTRRLEATMPLSANELEAEKDRLRAGHAMAARRLEMNIEALNRKASTQLVELSRIGEEARTLAEVRAEQGETIAALRGETAEQRATLDEAAAINADLAERLEAALDELEERRIAIERLEEMHEEERLAASSRQIELAARETDIRKLEDELGAARNQRKEAVRGTREAVAARKEAEAGLKVEEKRNADLQKKLESQMTALSNQQEKLERREGEVARLRGEMKEMSAASLSAEAAKRLRLAEEERDRLAAELADKSLQMRSLLAGGRGSEAPADAFAAEREKLQSRLSTLLKENKKLRADLQVAGGKARRDDGATAADDAALRVQIASLAAEVVGLAAVLEGPDSAIEQALSRAPEQAGAETPSLADRIRALRGSAGGN
ncbi:hypothetical protein [Nitratireductor pacificus]|uniref:Myosin-14 n=1 Tax=Nitratireductor pacificus pht-3B TaxID=391937 RepID=K2M8V5_9HYPH|nr:hypothetical protein [Nitratireductor pacificus]EKF17455.1 hypothetical protein NA2_18121 [Nitratireductor pacificus pht-3B]